MRSRYSAFAVGDAGYLLRTWRPSGRPETLTLDPALRWTRLGRTAAINEEIGFRILDQWKFWEIDVVACSPDPHSRHVGTPRSHRA